MEYVFRGQDQFTEAQQPAPSPAALTSIVLRSLDDPTRLVRFDTFETENIARAAGSEVYERQFEVKGPWITPATHAVYNEWEIADAKRVGPFVDSRRQLFEIRSKVLPTFAYDWLLRRLDHGSRYMVLGLYGDEEGATRLCRESPELQRFAQANPPTTYAAMDLTGMRCFRVESLSVK